MIDKSTLPTSWSNVALEDILIYVLGGDWGKDDTFDDPDYIKVLCIRASELRNWNEEKGETAALRKVKKTSLDKRELKEGDLILEISGGGPDQPVGRTALIDKAVLSKKSAYKKICTNFFRLIRPSNEINSKYLNFYLHFFYNSGKVSEYQAGSNNLRNLKFNDYIKINLPIAPVNEQNRIVAKIEELFSELDNGIAALKTAREQLKVYRQAILKHAFEGKLTAKWREENADKLETPEQLLTRIQQEREARYQQQLEEWKAAVKEWETCGKEGKKPSKPRPLKTVGPLDENITAELPGLPDGWFWGKLGNLTTGVEYGTSAKSSESGLVPVIRMGNLQNGIIDWADLVYTSNEEEIKKYALEPNDVLFNRTNSPELVGKTAKYRGEQPALFAGYLIRINQIDSIVISDYLNYFLNSHIAKQYGNTVKTDGVNQSNINGEKLQNYPFPFCSTSEQRKIVEIVEEKLSLTEASLNNIEYQLTRAEILRQSILKKGFSGELVPQDPNDESASDLLKHIKTEKSALAISRAINKKRQTKDTCHD